MKMYSKNEKLYQKQNYYKGYEHSFCMDRKEVVIKLIDSKRASILRVLANAKEELSLKEVVQKSNVPVASAHRILQELAALQLVLRRVWKTSKVYSIVKEESLHELFHEEYDGVQEFVQGLELISGIQHLILHKVGKEGKANIFVLGQDLDSAKIEEACTKVREKGIDISYLALTKQQYDQMMKMGLYGGEKKILK